MVSYALHFPFGGTFYDETPYLRSYDGPGADVRPQRFRRRLFRCARLPLGGQIHRHRVRRQLSPEGRSAALLPFTIEKTKEKE